MLLILYLVVMVGTDPDVREASITDEGILAFCDALGIDAQDPVMLALSCAMEAKTMGVYTRPEFRRGMHKLHCHSIEDLRGKLPTLRNQMRDRTQFSTIYSVRRRKSDESLMVMSANYVFVWLCSLHLGFQKNLPKRV